MSLAIWIKVAIEVGLRLLVSIAQTAVLEATKLEPTTKDAQTAALLDSNSLRLRPTGPLESLMVSSVVLMEKLGSTLDVVPILLQNLDLVAIWVLQEKEFCQ